MAMATIMAMRSTCGRGNVGVIATAGSRLIAGGYNGAPHGQDHCTAVGCDLSDGEEAGCQRAIHAEANLVAWAARAGVELEGATLYSTHSPCLRCAQLLAASRIAKFYFQRDYRLARLDILADAGVEIYKV
jgi:dCMP deaminase